MTSGVHAKTSLQSGRQETMPIERPITNGIQSIGDARSKRFRPRSEVSRVHDTLIYLQAWRDAYRPSAAFDISPLQVDASESRAVPQVCPDSALLAFAQLATWRLDVRRAFVTLVEADREYVLVEASKLMAFQHGRVKDVKDAASIGTCSFPRSDALTDRVVSTWQAARRIREPSTEDDYYYTEGFSPHWHVVRDLRSDSGCQNVPFVRHARWGRFYCAVPLRSARGSVIGSLFIMDDRPGYGISEEHLSFLEDISDTISQHLHSTVSRLQRQRSERLIQALSLFNSGKSSLRDWWINEEDNRVMNAGRLAEVSNDMIMPALREAKMTAEFGARRSSPVEHNEFGIAQSSKSREQSLDVPASLSNTSSGGRGISRPSISRHRTRTSVKFAKRDLDPAKAYDQTYSSASNLMREALGMEGVVFLDAQVVNATLKRTDSDDSEKSSDTAHSTSQDHDASGTEGFTTDGESSSLCKVLGSSIRSAGAELNHNIIAQKINMPESLLRSVLKRYPIGRVFNYGKDSELCSSSGDGDHSSSNEDSASKRLRRRVQSDAQRLLRVMPGARTIALLPLWNDAHSSWRSCAILFDTSIASSMESKDSLLYVSAFGHSLSAELSRLDTLMADKAKENFISSISHELRSPLHGVLAGVEFLQDSRLTVFQQEMAHTIAMAGRTLLDTINHLLDYAKISNFTTSQNRERRAADAARHKGALVSNVNEIGVTANIDLANLTEELTETVVSAYRFESSPRSTSRARTASFELTRGTKPALKQRSSNGYFDAEGVSVVLNIAWRENWIVEMQPGSWTRIVTNLVGNALKYTPRGTIIIQLEAVDGDGISDETLTGVRLTVEDTGSGISEAFLANDLFTPFKQEDSHSTGTGLGLNIVKQIADSMGAKINVESEVGRGTRFTITFNGNFADSKSSKRRSASDKPTSEETSGIGIDHFVLLSPILNHERNEKPQINALRKSVLRTSQEWLKCDALPASDLELTSGSNVCAIAEEDLLLLAESNSALLSSTMQKITSQGTIFLVLGSSIQALSLQGHVLPLDTQPLFVHQPIGPRKLLRAIATKTSSSTPLAAPDLNHFDRGTTSESADAPLQDPESRRHPHRQTSAATAATGVKFRGLPDSAESLSSEPDIPANALESGDSSQLDTVLLVEDNNVNMKLLVALMQKLSIRYKCAINGRDALDIYRSIPHRIFLVLMDMSMPVMDGYTATSKIRETARLRRLPRTTIVAVTGVTNAEAKQRAFESGVDEYRTKPIHMKALKKLIDSAQAREES